MRNAQIHVQKLVTLNATDQSAVRNNNEILQRPQIAHTKVSIHKCPKTFKFLQYRSIDKLRKLHLKNEN